MTNFSPKRLIGKYGGFALACIGAAGVIGTVILAVKATPKAIDLIQEEKLEKKTELTILDYVKTAGPTFIPTALMGIGTISCIFGVNALNKRQQAALVSAYTLLDKAYKDYKYRRNGETAKKSVSEIKYDENDIDEGDTLFFDEISCRYFKSTVEKVQEAEYKLNRALTVDGYATLNEFYAYLGLSPIDRKEDKLWTQCTNYDYYWQSWIDFSHEKVYMEDGTECYVLSAQQEPNLEYECF